MTTRTLSPASYDRLTATVARDTGERRTAALWIHAAALVRHAYDHGLAPADDRPPGPDGLLKSLENLANCHPALAPLADPAVLPLREQPLGAAAWAAVEEFWDRHPALEDERRVDGYALGDAYQLLSEEARKGRALCQTPPWVARLLLRLSLEPAMEEWGPADVRMIDPACGTGHIAVAAFHMVRVPPVHGRRPSPVEYGPRAVERALAAVSGVDLDAYAAALTAYRLLACSAHVLGVGLDRVPASWPVNVAAADSLLDRTEPLLAAGAYHACVANPPYITPKDPAIRDQVRAAYPQVAAGKYSLALPFTALMLDRLATPGGFVAQLTANVHEKGVRQAIRHRVPSSLRRALDHRHLRRLHPGARNTHLHSRAPGPAAGRRNGHGDPGQRRRAPRSRGPARGLVWRAIEDAVDSRLAWDRFQAGADFARLSGEPTP